MKEYQTNQPLVPDVARLLERIRGAFDAKWLTNFGALHEEFEAALREHLGCPHVLPVTNATFGLLAALEALDVRGEVITTPFTFPATPHVLFNRAGVRPVFVDVSPENFCISPQAVRRAITPETSAILAVHAYGYPCDHDALQEIATEHDLKLIYDAAPCFDVRTDGRSLLRHGDASVLSFHATKVFSTAEGGAVVCRDEELYRRCRLFINFGIAGEDAVMLPGLNGKLDEIRSAVGLLGLEAVRATIEQRRKVVERYVGFLRKTGFESISFHEAIYDDPRIDLNYAYFPVVVRSGGRVTRDRLYRAMQARKIIVRKYYHPTVLDLEIYKDLDHRIEDVQTAAGLSKSALCLPVNHFFDDADCTFILGELERCVSELERSDDE